MNCKKCNKVISETTKQGYQSNNLFWIKRGYCNQICYLESLANGDCMKCTKCGKAEAVASVRCMVTGQEQKLCSFCLSVG